MTGANDVKLFGEDGDDSLFLKGGDSLIWGGSGSDTFVISLETKSATIHDFESGVDLISFRGIEGIGSMSDLNIIPQNPNYTANSIISSEELQVKFKDMTVENFSSEDFEFL